jgi:ketosteroid isomerase-like protein
MEIGKELVALCKQGKNQEAIDRFYSPNIESVEPVAMPGMDEVHEGVAEGPFPHGDRFIVRFKYDVTPKHRGKRFTMEEMGLFTVQNGKIVKEEFFYAMG